MHTFTDTHTHTQTAGDATATVKLALLVNQTAVWGMPAAISSASTGLLRYLEEAAASTADQKDATVQVRRWL